MLKIMELRLEELIAEIKMYKADKNKLNVFKDAEKDCIKNKRDNVSIFLSDQAAAARAVSEGPGSHPGQAQKQKEGGQKVRLFRYLILDRAGPS